jgi:hypothetical protein
MLVVLAGDQLSVDCAVVTPTSLEQMLIEDLVQDVPTTPFVFSTGYFLDFACRSRTRLTIDCERRNMRAIAGGFIPAE